MTLAVWREKIQIIMKTQNIQMTPLILTFVSHFGEMGSRWGFNRTVGQV